MEQMTLSEAWFIMDRPITDEVGVKYCASTLRNQNIKPGLIFFYCEHAANGKLYVNKAHLVSPHAGL